MPFVARLGYLLVGVVVGKEDASPVWSVVCDGPVDN
jgi:hypothetical protein